ncbi:MAG: c-type cytochrome [Hydrogenobaculum sp.]
MKINVRNKVVTLVFSGVLIPQTSALAISPQELAKEKGCFACHAINHKVIGPAWKDVAVKYHHNLKYVPLLAKMIRNGNVGTWGPVPMPPQYVTKVQAEELAKFILSLK